MGAVENAGLKSVTGVGEELCVIYIPVYYIMLTDKNGAWDFRDEVNVGYILHRLDSLHRQHVSRCLFLHIEQTNHPCNRMLTFGSGNMYIHDFHCTMLPAA